MQISQHRYLLSIYVESVLKVFKHFNSLRVWISVYVFGFLILADRQVNFR